MNPITADPIVTRIGNRRRQIDGSGWKVAPDELDQSLFLIVVADDIEDAPVDAGHVSIQTPFDRPSGVTDVEKRPPRLGGEDLNAFSKRGCPRHVVYQQIEAHVRRQPANRAEPQNLRWDALVRQHEVLGLDLGPRVHAKWTKRGVFCRQRVGIGDPVIAACADQNHASSAGFVRDREYRLRSADVDRSCVGLIQGARRFAHDGGQMDHCVGPRHGLADRARIADVTFD